MSRPKEPLFFEAEFEKGYNYYIDKYYGHWKGEKYIGESRHRNLYLPYVPDRIRKVSNNPKFLILLRNPIDRAYSHWWHWYSRGVEKEVFDKVIEKNIENIGKRPRFINKNEIDLYVNTLNFNNGYSPYLSYIDSGYYHEQIIRYINIFGEENVKIIIFEDFICDAAKVLKDICCFIGIEYDDKMNVSPKNKAMNSLGVKVVERLSGVSIKKYISKKYKSFVNRKIEDLFSVGDDKPKISDETKKELARHYENEIFKVENLLGYEIKGWRI